MSNATVFWPEPGDLFLDQSVAAMCWSQQRDMTTMTIFGAGEVWDNTSIIIKLQFSQLNCSDGDTDQHLDTRASVMSAILDSGHKMLCKVFHIARRFDANWMNIIEWYVLVPIISPSQMAACCNTQQYSYLNIYNHAAFMVRLFCDQTETAVTTKFREEQPCSSCKQTQIDQAGNINII